MKNNITILIAFLCCFFVQNTFAQIAFEKGTPTSFEKNLKNNVPTKQMAALDYDRLLKEDEKDEAMGMPPRFGYMHKVEYNLENSGIWETLANGDRVWRLTISAPKARTININYSQFDIPWEAQLFIYNEKGKDVLGPFTRKNMKVNGEFATGFTKGKTCTIEYYEPQKTKGQSHIEIGGIIHGYKSVRSFANDLIKAFQSSGGCNNDVACAMSAGWEDQIKSVGMLLTAGNTRYCTGALINTTANDCRPYFLSANHCFSADNPGDVLNDIVMFNYNSPSPACPGVPTTDGPTNQTVQGMTVRAKGANSDFCLLELTNNPLPVYDVYYSGWNRANSGVTETTAIHHPSGDVKKFSQDFDPPVSSNFGGSPAGTHWETEWETGTTEPGSSGSPVFDQDMCIIGQLHGGSAACSGSNNLGQDYYGKIWYSWDQNGAANTARLDSWLDPLGTGTMHMLGSDCSTPVPPVADFNPVDGSTYNFCTSGAISFTDLSAGIPTGWSWTFSGAGVSPTTSTAQNPSVTVTASGTLTVTLTVTNAQGTDAITQTYNITVDPACSINTFCDVPATAIPDNDPAGLTTSFNVGPSAIITDINIDIDISHTWVGDLIIQVTHNGTTVTLMDQPGVPASGFGCGSDNVLATFDDEGVNPVETECAGGPAIAGIVIPEQALSAFDGMDQAGAWTILISDNADQDLGTFNEWCLTIESTVPACPTCPPVYTHATACDLQTLEVTNADYESDGHIYTSQSTVIQAGAVVDYDATTYIDINQSLDHTFEVKLGAVWHAFIDGCDNGGGGSNLKGDNPVEALQQDDNTGVKTEKIEYQINNKTSNQDKK